ncbi:MAG: hypothetical protein ACT4OU_04705 [Hyphomicrobium sp.]
MTESVIGKAKRSVDSTIDAYLGRAAFAASILAATVFAIAGAWIALVDRYGTVNACFALSLALLSVSVVVRLTIAARERAAAEDLADVEKSLENSGGPVAQLAGVKLPVDLSTALSVAPFVLPLLRSTRILLPIVFAIGLVVALMTPSRSQAVGEAPQP